MTAAVSEDAYSEIFDMHTDRPSVYLDQWVWIRLAKAAVGRPKHPADLAVLQAVQYAAEAGIAFPLSSTHYYETLSVKSPRWRSDLAAVMAPISRFVNLRGHGPLLRHQILGALHESFGRPYFRPAQLQVLGLGAQWAMLGKPALPEIMFGDRKATDSEVPNRRALVRSMAQYAETSILAGPQSDDEIDELRRFGYRPEQVALSTQSRLDWEKVYADLVKANPVDKPEMRVHLMAREFIHEYMDMFNEIAGEYHLDMFRLMREDPSHPGSMREDMMRFSNLVPTMRIAADMKVEQFRNPTRPWTVNMMHDIDALSHALPYCHIVVPDRDAADLLRRSGAHLRHGTTVVTKFEEIPSALAGLEDSASALLDRSGWDEVGPPAPFCASWDDLPRTNAG